MKDCTTILVPNQTAELIVFFLNKKLKELKVLEDVVKDIQAQLEEQAGSYSI